MKLLDKMEGGACPSIVFLKKGFRTYRDFPKTGPRTQTQNQTQTRPRPRPRTGTIENRTQLIAVTVLSAQHNMVFGRLCVIPFAFGMMFSTASFTVKFLYHSKSVPYTR
jgi:hypothetical protein